MSNICLISGSPISEGDRVAVLILEQQTPAPFDHSLDKLSSPRGVFGRGEYKNGHYPNYGWISPDPDQPEFEGLLKGLIGVGPEAEVQAIYKAMRQMTDRPYRLFSENYPESRRGALWVAFLLEEVLDRAVAFLENQFELGEVIQSSCNKIAEALLAQQALELKLQERDLQSAEQKSPGRQQQEYFSDREERGDLRNLIWDSENALLKLILPLNSYPYETLAELLLHLHPLPPEAVPPTQALANQRWVKKIAEVGAFYRYHELILCRPVCRPFPLSSNKSRASECRWLSDLLNSKLDS